MPIDSVSSGRPSALQRLEQLAQGPVRPALRLEVARPARESPSGRAGAAAAAPRPRGAVAATSRGARPLFDRLAADVDLQADVERRQRRRPLRAQPLGELEPVDRVHPVEVARRRRASCCSAAARSGATRSARAGRRAQRSSRRPPARSSRRSGSRPRRCAARTASGPKVLLTTSNVTLCTGRPAPAQALAMRSCTRASLSAIIALLLRRAGAPQASCRRARRHFRKSHGHYPTAGVLGQEQGLRPAPFGRPAADDPRSRRRAPHQCRPARAQAGARHGVRHHERLAAEELRGDAGVRLLVRDPGPGALPRQRLQPEPRRRRRVPDDSLEDPDPRAAQLPAGLRRALAQAARHGAVHRPDRLGQVDDAGGDGQPPQRERVRPRPDGRGPDRVRARVEEVPDQPARGRPAHARRSPTRCARRCARTRTASWSARCATSRRSAWR